MDHLDQALLVCLQQNNLQTADRLAEQVGRSPSAVARRVRRLRSGGAIVAETAILSDAAAGHPLSAVIHVQLERVAPHEGNLLRQQLVAHPQVQMCLDVAGAFEIVLLVVAANMDVFNDFTLAMLEQPIVRRFETSFVKKRHKASLAVPLV
ncbi:Lrp/AsnC family transcriptional regulator [Brevundimonas sp. R86498]|uniref:Lrp/AsnC family transcriptional regulator n=1 Tax=Brevundimonas sp. R86498 TaxID=3093845 RepID=UPI0037CAB00A